jgi:putative ATP-binding cassette transporter
MRDVLDVCGLPELAQRLHEKMPWSQQLSPGEQQRIAMIRILLLQPD